MILIHNIFCLFFQDDQIFNEWKKLVPEIKREFKPSDKLCERHFATEDIITTWEHIINGKKCVLERAKPKLKDSAIPKYFLDVPEQLCVS